MSLPFINHTHYALPLLLLFVNVTTKLLLLLSLLLLFCHYYRYFFLLLLLSVLIEMEVLNATIVIHRFNLKQQSSLISI